MADGFIATKARWDSDDAAAKAKAEGKSEAEQQAAGQEAWNESLRTSGEVIQKHIEFLTGLGDLTGGE